MGAVGLEPTYPKVPHFECGASTNSTTLPRLLKNNELSYYNKNHFIDYASGKGRAISSPFLLVKTFFDKDKVVFIVFVDKIRYKNENLQCSNRHFSG